MAYLILFFKGFIIGIGKIIPGVSGSILAVGVYEKALDYLVNWKEKKQESLKFLVPLGLGVALAIVVFSKIILVFLNIYPLLTLSLFWGLLLGTSFKVVKKMQLTFKDYIIIFSLAGLFLFLTKNISLPNFVIKMNIDYLWVIILGVLDAISMIIPGLSGTALYVMLGSYPFVLNLLSNPLENIWASCCFAFGFVLAFFLIAKLLNYLFQNYFKVSWLVIAGFIIYSLGMFWLNIPFEESFSAILLTIGFILLGFLVVLWAPLE